MWFRVVAPAGKNDPASDFHGILKQMYFQLRCYNSGEHDGSRYDTVSFIAYTYNSAKVASCQYLSWTVIRR